MGMRLFYRPQTGRPFRVERYLAALRERPAFGRALERTKSLFLPV
jgi:hypothetical protein